MRQFLLFITAILSVQAQAEGEPSIMLGPVARHSATILVQGSSPASVALEIEQLGSEHRPIRTDTVSLNKGMDFLAKFELDSLISGTAYSYKLVWNNVLQDPTYQFTTQSRREAKGLKVYLGSCAHLLDPETDGSSSWSGNYEIFDSIAYEAAFDTQTNLMLWLGDNLYFRQDDYERPTGMAQRYRKVRTHPSLQKLLAAMPHYAIWDDHDYGPNDSNQSFIFKQSSLELFRRYWPNPSAGLPDAPGIFTQFSVEDAEFFLLDDRWYRDSDKEMSENKSLYGNLQLHWLKNAILSSRARFKFIAGGSQFLNDHSRHEGWHNFKQERSEFLSWLRLNNISGVIFLSGDRHHTELLKLERTDTYPLFELTCSPLTSGTRRLKGIEADNPMRVAGTLVETRNYCSLSADGKDSDRTLAIKSMDTQGNQLWEIRIKADLLK